MALFIQIAYCAFSANFTLFEASKCSFGYYGTLTTLMEQWDDLNCQLNSKQNCQHLVSAIRPNALMFHQDILFLKRCLLIDVKKILPRSSQALWNNGGYHEQAISIVCTRASI